MKLSWIAHCKIKGEENTDSANIKANKKIKGANYQ